MMNERKNILRDKSFLFAVQAVKLYKHLMASQQEYVISKQMLRSATSVGANVREAYNAESKNDFIHKLSIAQKECDETMYWLELLKETNSISVTEFNLMINNAGEVLKIIRSSILTTKKNMVKR